MKKILLAVLICAAAAVTFGDASTDSSKAEYLSGSLADRIYSASQDWGNLGFDTAARSGDEPGMKLRIKDKEYAYGLGHYANGEIVVELGGRFKTFEAEIGVQWQGGKGLGSVIFQIYADDKKVFESGVLRENDPPVPITVSVERVRELRLAANDAGNRNENDYADWADARLTCDPAAAKESSESTVDIAPFGQVLAWDPKVMEGTKARRTEEFPAEDVAPFKEILPSADGTYQVPAEGGTSCIGLQWDENRPLRRVGLEFPDTAAVPPVEAVQLQCWDDGLGRQEGWPGGSAWQGKWKAAGLTPDKAGSRLAWFLSYKQIARGTQKVRWVFAGTGQPIVLKAFSAYTRSPGETVDVRIESTRPEATVKGELDIYNGALLNPPEKSPYHCAWDASKPLLLKIRSTAPQPYKADRTVLRFRFPDTAFGVAIEDLLANDCVYVPHAGVFVTRVPAPITLDEYLKKIAGRKTVLEKVQQSPDQDFPRAWAAIHSPNQDLGPTMISLANDNRKFIVQREGAVLFNEYDRPDDPQGARPPSIFEAFSTQWRCVPSFGRGKDLKFTRHLQGGWLPIPVTTVTEGGVVYRQTTFVAPMSDAPAGSPFWYRDRALCAAEYRVGNGGNEAADVKLGLNFAGGKDHSFQLQEIKEGVLVVRDDRVLALIDIRAAAPLAVKREAEGVVLSGKLPFGAAARCFAFFPAWKVAPKDYAILLEGAEAAPRVEAYWTTLLKPAMQIEIPDTLLANIIRASQVNCLLAARNEDRGARISPWTSADRYGPLESESNAVIRGMDMNGQPDFARRGLEFWLKTCNKEGFVTLGYTIVGTGELLWTLGEHYDRTRDRVWMKEFAPDVVRICRWVIRQREKTKRLDAQGRKVPEFGLMTPGVSADWNRFAYRFFNDSQYLLGLENAGKALADIGDPAAPAILADVQTYRTDITRAYHWMQARTPVVPLKNGAWVPADPSLMGCYGNVEDFMPGQSADLSYVYSVELGAHHLVANKTLDPGSADADWMINYLEDTHFPRTTRVEAVGRSDDFDWGGFAKMQPYYCRIAEIYALRDDMKPFVRSYFNTIPGLLNFEDLTFWEDMGTNGFAYGGWNKTHETGWFLCQTRIMFVTERGDELWLAPFVTNHWLKDGMKVTVRNAPTQFGVVNYTIASNVAKGEIEAVVQLAAGCTAKKVVLRLRHPEGKPIQSVIVQGKPHKDFDPRKETITIEPSGKTIKVQARYGG
jgi:hypothetical protein